MFNLEVEIVELQAQILRMSEQLNIAPGKIVKTEAVLLLKQVVKFTAPDGKTQGQKAVQRDITRAITPLDPGKFRNKNMAKLMRQRNLPALNEIMKRVPGWEKWEVVPFDPQSLHQAKRDKRGRIQRFKKKFTVETSAWKTYNRGMRDRVGSAKASWALGIQKTGGSLPGWIGMHTAEGRYTTTLVVLTGDKPKLVITTSAKGVVNDPSFERNLARVMGTRLKAMVNKTKRMLSDPLKYANLFAQYQ